MREYDQVMSLLDWPPIFLVSNAQFKSVEGDEIEDSYEIAAVKYPIMTLARGLKGKVLKNCIWHGLGHHLFPSWEHWRIEAFAEVMARGGGKGYYCKQTGHSVDDMPPRAVCLRLAQRAAKRMKRG